MEGRHARISEIGDSAKRRLRIGGEFSIKNEKRRDKPETALKMFSKYP